MPSAADEFPSANVVLNMPLTKAAYRAIKRKRTGDIAVIASEIQRDGFPDLTAGQLRRQLVDTIGEELGEYVPDMRATYDSLMRLAGNRIGVPMAQEAIQEIIDGKADPVTIFRNLLRKAEDEILLPDIGGMSTDDWEVPFILEQERLRERFKSNKALTFPPEYTKMASMFPDIEPGMIGLIAETGVGKTSLLQRIAHFWASQGHKVLYDSTEANELQMQKRWLTTVSNVPFGALKRGVDTAELRKLLKPLANGGHVQYIQGNNRPLPAIISQAIRNDQHIVIDVFSDAVLTDYKGETETSRLLMALKDLDAFCSKYRKVVMLSLQITAERRRIFRAGKQLLTLADASGGAHYENKLSLGMVLNFPHLKHDYQVWEPRIFPQKETVKQIKGNFAQLGVWSVGKARYGEPGASHAKALVWRDDKSYSLQPTHPENLEHLMGVFEAMINGKEWKG